MNRSRITIAVLVVAACAGLSYAIRIMRPTKFARSNDRMVELLNKLPPELRFAGQADVPLRMSETLLQVASLQEGNTATEAETEAAMRVLGHDSVAGLRSGAYDAADVARRQKPAVQPPLPGKPDKEPPTSTATEAQV